MLNHLKLINKICSSYKHINPNKISSLNKVKSIHTSSYLFFYERDPEFVDNTPVHKHIRDGFYLLKDELKLWKNEVIETFESDPLAVVPGAIDKAWSFESTDKLNKWVTTCDADHGDGYSSCELIVNEHGKGIFQGILNTELPSDGKMKKTGYCNMRSIKPTKSFRRDTCHDWAQYTYLVFRVRGDGRPYIINLATPGYFDILWNDVYQYVLHTRGGPYWQTTKIPFSKFILSSKGKIQDNQTAIPLHMVTNLGLTMADKVSGPFKLEIDYIGLEYDPEYTEEFAYEMYKLPKDLANS
ncbi:complex I intermediate-associated protein 30 [Lycorma delicatula]|uniref:complex I intermediate-associated protein 30 n=1 Tax=Lycorma delicatula TaxID=130591 RepID=UPI003F512C42